MDELNIMHCVCTLHCPKQWYYANINKVFGCMRSSVKWGLIKAGWGGGKGEGRRGQFLRKECF